MASPTVTIPTTGNSVNVDDITQTVNQGLKANHDNIEDHKAVTGNPHSATTDDIPETATRKYLSEPEQTKLAGLPEGAALPEDQQKRVVAPSARAETRAAWSSDLTGLPQDRPPLTSGELVSDADLGQSLLLRESDITGGTFISLGPRKLMDVVPGGAWRVDVDLKRRVDAVDPVYSTVRVLVQNMNASKGHYSQAQLYSETPTVADGVQRLSFVIRVDGQGDYQLPAPAVHFGVFLRVYSDPGELLIGRMTVTEFTQFSDVQNIAPADLPVSQQQLAAINSKLNKQTNLADLGDVDAAKENLDLNQVDNVRDVNKPVSLAQAAAIADQATRTADEALARLEALAGLLGVFNPELPSGQALKIKNLVNDVIAQLSLEGELEVSRLRLANTDFELGSEFIRIIGQADGKDLLSFDREGRLIIPGIRYGVETFEDPPRHLFEVRSQIGELLAAVSRDWKFITPASEAADAANEEKPIDLAFPNQLHMIEGYSLTLHPDTMMTPGAYTSDVVASFGSIREADQFPFEVEGRNGQLLDIDPSRCGPYTELQIQRDGQETALRRNLVTRIAPANALQGLSPVIVGLGDSYIESYILRVLQIALEAMGATPTFIGDIRTREVGANHNPPVTSPIPGITSSVDLLSEGRGGTEAADWVYQNTDDMAPVTDWDAYRALSSADKENYNPFIRPATGQDPADFVFNGYIFDPAYYFANTGHAVPKVWLINLGRNDVTQQDRATAISNISNAARVIMSQIRNFDPNALIIWSFPRYSLGHDFAREEGFEERRTNHLVARALVERINDLDDDRMVVAPLWALTGGRLGWRTDTAETDPQTGVLTVRQDDTVHPHVFNGRKCGWALAAIIANHADLF